MGRSVDRRVEVLEKACGVIKAVVGLGVPILPFNYSSHCSKCKKATHILYCSVYHLDMI